MNESIKYCFLSSTIWICLIVKECLEYGDIHTFAVKSFLELKNEKEISKESLFV